jgi:hypothetical protein
MFNSQTVAATTITTIRSALSGSAKSSPPENKQPVPFGTGCFEFTQRICSVPLTFYCNSSMHLASTSRLGRVIDSGNVASG